jgi:molybdopterin-guanine dinucleotide biosynthesis protein MobB
MVPVVIAVVGGKKSGKTATIEILTEELTQRGYKIAAVKHIPEPDFTIDTKGKDTWKFARSGAKIVVAVSAAEIATIEKTESRNLSLRVILRKCRGSDLVFLEGFRKLVAEDKSIYKIVVVRSPEEIEESLEIFDPILAFTGPYQPKSGLRRIPYVDVREDSERLVDLVERIVKKKAAT